MSQHHFSAGDLTVIAGWDRPLGQFFLTVYREADDLSTLVYCNLDDPDALPGGGLSVAQIVGRLAVLGIEPPPGLLGNLIADAQSPWAGNRVVIYEERVK